MLRKLPELSLEQWYAAGDNWEMAWPTEYTVTEAVAYRGLVSPKELDWLTAWNKTENSLQFHSSL